MRSETTKFLPGDDSHRRNKLKKVTTLRPMSSSIHFGSIKPTKNNTFRLTYPNQRPRTTKKPTPAVIERTTVSTFWSDWSPLRQTPTTTIPPQAMIDNDLLSIFDPNFDKNNGQFTTPKSVTSNLNTDSNTEFIVPDWMQQMIDEHDKNKTSEAGSNNDIDNNLLSIFDPNYGQNNIQPTTPDINNDLLSIFDPNYGQSNVQPTTPTSNTNDIDNNLLSIFDLNYGQNNAQSTTPKTSANNDNNGFEVPDWLQAMMNEHDKNKTNVPGNSNNQQPEIDNSLMSIFDPNYGQNNVEPTTPNNDLLSIFDPNYGQSNVQPTTPSSNANNDNNEFVVPDWLQTMMSEHDKNANTAANQQGVDDNMLSIFDPNFDQKNTASPTTPSSAHNGEFEVPDWMKNMMDEYDKSAAVNQTNGEGSNRFIDGGGDNTIRYSMTKFS